MFRHQPTGVRGHAYPCPPLARRRYPRLLLRAVLSALLLLPIVGLVYPVAQAARQAPAGHAAPPSHTVLASDHGLGTGRIPRGAHGAVRVMVALASPRSGLEQQATQGLSGEAGDWDGQFFHGTGGTARGPFSLQGGRYHIYVQAFYNSVHSSGSCAFTARLQGVEHPLPYAFSNLGTAVALTDSGFAYRLPLTIIAPSGHYSLIVSPFTTCDWSVSIIGGISTDRLLAVGPVGLTRPEGSTSTSATVAHLQETLEFSAVYETRDAAAVATGTVSLMQHGKTVRTYTLHPEMLAMGLPQFHRFVTFGETTDRALLGPLTARFTITLGGARVTRSVDFTLVPAAPARPLVITDVSVFHKVMDHYPATKVVHLSEETGFTATYLRTASGHTTPRGTLSVIRRGTVTQTFKLDAVTTDDGQTGFYTIIHWDAADAALLGPLTARVTLTLDSTSVSRSVDFTLVR